MRRLGVDLLIQAEEDVEDKDADQMQQRAVVCLTCLLMFLINITLTGRDGVRVVVVGAQLHH